MTPPVVPTPPRPRLLLDSPSLIYRAFFAVPATIRDPAGRPINAVRGYLDMCATLLGDRRPAALVHVLDADWRPAFRAAAYPGYKSKRLAEPEDLTWQFTLIDEIVDAAGLETATTPGYEADDVLATLAEAATPEAPAEIVSGDRDLLQLVRDPAVAVLFTRKGVRELDRFDEAMVTRKYGIPPRAYADFAILRGDPSDGLPGVRGIGEQSAATLVSRYGSIAGVREAAAAGQAGFAPRQAAAVRDAAAYLDAMEIVVQLPRTLALDHRRRRAPEAERLRAIGARHAVESPVERLLTALEVLPDP